MSDRARTEPCLSFETRGDSLVPAFGDELTRKARAHFAALGVPDRFVYAATYESQHAFPANRRHQAYAWPDRRLRDRASN